MNQLIDKEELAGLFRVSIRTLDRLRASGKLKWVGMRGRVLFDPEEVRAFLAGQQRVGRGGQQNCGAHNQSDVCSHSPGDPPVELEAIYPIGNGKSRPSKPKSSSRRAQS